MIVNPKKILSTLMQSETVAIESLEQTIDEHLTAKFQGEHTDVCFDYNEDCRRLRPFVLEKLLNKYRQEGWKVKIESDQREGNYIRFSYHPTKSSGYGDR